MPEGTMGVRCCHVIACPIFPFEGYQAAEGLPLNMKRNRREAKTATGFVAPMPLEFDSKK
jgi:hypothetical protein